MSEIDYDMPEELNTDIEYDDQSEMDMFDYNEEDIEDSILLEEDDDNEWDNWDPPQDYTDTLATRLEDELPYGYEAVGLGPWITVRPQGNRSVPSLEIDVENPDKSEIQFNDFFDNIDTISLEMENSNVPDMIDNLNYLIEVISKYEDILYTFKEMDKE